LIGSGLASVVFGLASAACWGAGDFCGGLATKRTHVYNVIISSQVVSVFLLIGLALIFRETPPSGDYLLLGGVAGLAGAAGLISLYRALATGRMGVAAPVSAVVGAGFPVMIGALTEGVPRTLQLIGFGVAFLAVWFISRAGSTDFQIRDLGLPLLAGLSFGVFFVIIGRLSDNAILWPLVAARFASLSALWIVATISRQPRIAAKAQLPLIVLIGIMEVGGNAFYALAGHVGRLDVAAVVASLYPATTVWLAWLILKEHLSRSQLLGIVAALAAIVLISV
jgi:drug/metabolite transporter (DMT)-like permease